ncbi:MAG: sortase [Candidatus Pacebacteria bacterium]|nr:sortase [Candidatus Paceibacterota bacterium]
MDIPVLSQLKVPKPEKKTSWKSLVAIFVTAFVIIMIVLNGPTLYKAIKYPFTHTPEADNELLTQQYRDLYGYDKHPEIITSALKSNAAPTLKPTQPTGPVGQAQLSAIIDIPKIGVSAPVLQVSNNTDATVLAALKKGVVLYPGSSMPGQSGTSVIIGHSSSDLPWTAYSAVFSLLGKLEANDIIYVTVGPTKYAYKVTTIQKGSAQQLVSSGLTGDLVVSTCWPIGTDLNRVAVSATLIK